ncbi:hypothetical protein [Lactobacillus sp. PV034]|uniref:hypothetical protein n=1 Tax=Lactobacillus sp. PV034 TaxID=2594495 RepID=UPI002240D2C3|nr:hypothetical protein [Lactobacillus sp. PV034]QNQ80209.1 hypothetical protein FP432_00885 [Lactobacillus sp. PV034]
MKKYSIDKRDKIIGRIIGCFAANFATALAQIFGSNIFDTLQLIFNLKDNYYNSELNSWFKIVQKIGPIFSQIRKTFLLGCNPNFFLISKIIIILIIVFISVEETKFIVIFGLIYLVLRILNVVGLVKSICFLIFEFFALIIINIIRKAYVKLNKKKIRVAFKIVDDTDLLIIELCLICISIGYAFIALVLPITFTKTLFGLVSSSVLIPIMKYINFISLD